MIGDEWVEVMNVIGAKSRNLGNENENLFSKRKYNKEN